ncbi:choice-of-anchor D domain-containing protein [Granulicella sp. WH15]|uniref:beta strand repeat-containing protein n=1 Tax=Granulicella sp. WH15 TaxID=2602070 RepID=UPI00136689E1|nr:FG-GAP-like repeat-containing protein [Granulicella sp. WH15]QHN03569.1 choice-of-anchor D domain-containing protein [Granulicella sp. WH15]
MVLRRFACLLLSLLLLPAVSRADAPYVHITPSNLVFPTTSASSTSALQTVVVQTSTPISSIVVTGSFAIDSTSTCSTATTPDEQCFIFLKAAPTPAGALNGTLTLTIAGTAYPVALSFPPLASGATNTTISSSGATAPYTLTGTVAGSRGAASPTGNVSFVDTTNSNITLGTATLSHTSLTYALNTFSPPPTGDQPEAIASGDFNGDGKLDIVVANGGTPGCGPALGLACPNSLTLELSNGDGTFTSSTINSVNFPSGLAVADFNGDGKLDIAATDGAESTVTILLGKGDGTFTKVATPEPTGNYPDQVAAGDFDGNGRPDLAIIGGDTGSTLTVLFGNGDGTFTARPTSFTLDGYGNSLALGDLNGDGKLDIAVSVSANSPGGSSSIAIFLGTGTTTFNLGTPISSAGMGSDGSFGALALGDFNGDKKLDLITYLIDDEDTMNILPLLGNGDGTFKAQTAIATKDDSYETSFGVGDFDGDGKADFSMASDTHFSVFLSNGDGTFKTPVSLTGADTEPSYLSQVVGDFNKDGLADMAIADGDLNEIFLEMSNLTATATATLTGVSVPGSGAHAVSATYAGDANFTASTSATTPLNGALTTTTLKLSSSASSSTFGTQIVLTAILSPYTTLGLKTDGETIIFYSGTTSIGVATLSSGVATLNVTSLAVGTDSVTAKYANDSNFAAATSNTVSITVSAATATLTVSPTSLTFPAQLQGTSSTAQTVTLTNSGTAAVTISNIAITGDFAKTTTCGTSLAAAGTCTISVTFTPASAGERTGTITITDSASGSPHIVALTGTGTGFSLSPTSTTLTIATPGGTATTAVQVASVNGFTGTANLTCAVTYQGTGTPTSAPTCALSPASVPLSATAPVSTTLTISSTAAKALAAPLELFRRSGVAFAALLCLGLIPRRYRRRLVLPVLCFFMLGATMGCGGSSLPATPTTPSSTGTTTGSYKVIVTAASGSYTATSTIMLNVQ